MLSYSFEHPAKISLFYTSVHSLLLNHFLILCNTVVLDRLMTVLFVMYLVQRPYLKVEEICKTATEDFALG